MKLSNQVELEIERLMDSDLERNLSTPKELGRAKRLEDANARYTEFLKNTFPKGQTLEGFKIVVDCANGAAYKTAPVVFWELGAEVVSTGIEPNGFNINDKCGSTNPENISSLVLESKADIGISFDGDADRVIVCDENGQIINGDQLLALIATEWKALKRLEGNGVVGTYMSNLGLERYLNSIELDLIRVEVGDRYVKERMYKDKINIGGEPSGHIIVSNYSTTGDGIVTALQVLSIIVSKKDKASKICKIFSSVPQILKNFESSDLKLLNNSDAKKIIADAEEALGKNNGRLLVRASGTENLIRVMGECENEHLLNSTVDKVVDKLKDLAN
jgi:phosphoglucosamine mutase